MWRKVLGIGAVVLLVGALLGGGAYIVLRDDGGQGSGLRAGRGGSGAGNLGGGGNAGRGGGGAGLGNGGRAASAAAGTLGSGGGAGLACRAGNGSGWNNQGALDASATTTGTRSRGAATERGAAGDDRVRQTITGTVLVADTDLVIQVADGTTLTVSTGPARDRQAQGVSFLPADTVRLTGFENPAGTFVVAEIENLSRGGVLVLRDADGRPLWSGNGRRGS